MNNANRLNTCLVCGHRLLANEGFPLENRRVFRHRKILNSTGMDLELASLPFVPNFSKLEPIAHQILSADDPESIGQVATTRGEAAEAV